MGDEGGFAPSGLSTNEQPLELMVLARDARNGDPGALPEVVVVDLGHRCADAVLQLRLRGTDVVTLLLQRMRVWEVQLAGEHADIAAGHGPNVNCPTTRAGRGRRLGR